MTLPLWTVSCWRWRVREPIDQTRSCFKATLEKDQVSEVDLDRKDVRSRVGLRRIWTFHLAIWIRHCCRGHFGSVPVAEV
jgi:hypothetical protein